MANKSRPKKVKAPYRKYVGGQGFVRTLGFNNTLVPIGDGLYVEEQVIDENEYIDDYNSEISKKGKNRRKNSLKSNRRNSSGNDKRHISDADLLSNMQLLDIGGSPMKVPYEIQKLIIYYCDDTPLNFLLVCKAWYWMCLPSFYKSPTLSSRNFNMFVSTIIDNKKRKFGEYVYELDLSTILQSGKNSHVSKLLRRCSPRLEKFTAPQTSFGYTPLVSLKSCHNLKYLDLGLVSETVKLKELFSAISNFRELTHLAFPRSSIDCEGFREFVWPPNLQYVKLSGGITNEFVRETIWPRTITTLEFSYCPKVDEHAVYTVLSQIGDNLKHLFFHYPMPSLHDNSLDYIFRYCSNLISVQLMVDYCSKWTFSEHMLTKLIYPRPLKTIYLESSGALGLASKIHPDDFTIAIMESRLPCLKNISISSKLGWDMQSSDVEDLVCAFEDQGGGLYLNY
ncbi:hypothetical protein Kpol_1023p36 [Vanderwaltozyma polyspora DSM 70294]|uniref:F-box domain-containing protein n=1 Tax=Vanderwaltozyma polyspora (strain ATCC 22028 / DSM 70294 / BCRC 21397 / CBS 2163 / NBRC 10782 / NRRL Y-8283 / UCD 57-17) TaxID=436907 RepID=A7TFQ9_VANPO|nr:uncharacterized protein Kpol_1023p36 [Vanderwaltozyma polyspora DSM 70294]EDO18867.1 hypothetical protein Kpol_1023p36 [Vanderwaltozyma polyspora DSM 70294]